MLRYHKIWNKSVTKKIGNLTVPPWTNMKTTKLAKIIFQESVNANEFLKLWLVKRNLGGNNGNDIVFRQVRSIGFQLQTKRRKSILQWKATIKASDTLKHPPTHGLASSLRMRTAISPGQWQPRTAVSALLDFISMADPPSLHMPWDNCCAVPSHHCPSDMLWACVRYWPDGESVFECVTCFVVMTVEPGKYGHQRDTLSVLIQIWLRQCLWKWLVGKYLCWPVISYGPVIIWVSVLRVLAELTSVINVCPHKN